jgi:cytochrome c oxidase assembly factor CtaG
MIWWCSARGIPWDGSWQAYPGVWLFSIAIGVLFWRIRSRDPLPPSIPSVRSAPSAPWWRRAAIPAGTLLLWITLDWPLGPLGTGYLASVHSAQFLLLAMVVPPVLLLGVDRRRIEDALSRHPRLARAVGAVTQPLVAIVAFAVTMVLTHLPAVVDALMATQVGAFALDVAWFGSGLLFWWPVIVRVPERSHFPPLMRMLYLFFGTQPHLYIAMWLLSADFPAYATYELAPRVIALSAVTDQQIAGALMLAFGATYVIGVISVMFFQWSGSHRVEEPDGLAGSETRDA